MLIDCHTHWADCFTERDGLDPSHWLEVLDRYGVTHAVVLPFTGLLDAGKIPQDNETVAAVCRASGGRMIPFCTVNTWFPEEAERELERALGTLGHRGIKFHPWLQGQSVSLPAMDRVCEIAAAHDVPILFHDGTPPFSLPSQVALLALRHPRTRLILGHCGMLEHWREAAAAMNAAPNVWGCLCSPHFAGMRHVVGSCDPGRLVWGSDFGYSFNDTVDYRLEQFRSLGLSDEAQRAILNDNPRRLLRLDGAAGA